MLSQMIAYRLLGAKPLFYPVPACCKLRPCKQIIVKFVSKYINKIPLNISSAKCWPLYVSILPLSEKIGASLQMIALFTDKIVSRVKISALTNHVPFKVMIICLFQNRGTIIKWHKLSRNCAKYSRHASHNSNTQCDEGILLGFTSNIICKYSDSVVLILPFCNVQ